MMSINKDKKREQLYFLSMEDLVPKDHILRDIERAIDLSFIYELVEDKYSTEKGRPSIDPVMLIKIPLIQYLFGIKSMRQTIKEIQVNVAYRWFLGLDMLDAVPHFSTFSKNYTRRFKDTDLFEQIFSKILEECISNNFVDTSTVFVDATHIKAAANKHKSYKQVAQQEALFYEKNLKDEINKDREDHGKKPFKDDENHRSDTPGSSSDNNPENTKSNTQQEILKSVTDPESGLFHKGEHKQVFAYVSQTFCDKWGWILGYSIHPGNEHDSRTFKAIYEKIKKFSSKVIVADAGYKTPAIAKMLIDDKKMPVFPYKRPYTGKDLFKKYEYAYDEYYDCYVCPNNQILSYSTTNRDGYKEYKSKGYICENCPYLSQCTKSKNHTKVVMRHVWEEYMEICEDIRHTRGTKEIYDKRKETIERIFGDAKENHGLRYTHYIGKARMEMKVGLTFACINLIKLAKIKKRLGLLAPIKSTLLGYKRKNIKIKNYIRQIALRTIKSKCYLSTI